MECCHEFSQLLATYIDVKKAFNSVHGKTLWEILSLWGIPTRVIRLIGTYWYWKYCGLVGPLELLSCKFKS